MAAVAEQDLHLFLAIALRFINDLRDAHFQVIQLKSSINYFIGRFDYLDGVLGASGFVNAPLAHRIASGSDFFQDFVIIANRIQFGCVEILERKPFFFKIQLL